MTVFELVFAKIIISTFLIFCVSAQAQSDGDSFFILPMASVNGDQGLSVGGELLWANISSTSWTLRGFGFHSFAYESSVLGLGLQNRKFMDWLYISANVLTSQTNKSLFYGYGNFSSLESPSQYSLQTFVYDLRMGINIIENGVIGVGYGSSRSSVGRGARESEAQYVDRYADRRFVSGSYSNLYKFFALYDSSSPEFAPVKGTKAQVQYEMGTEGIEPEVKKFSASVVHLIPVFGEDLIVAVRSRHERTWGGDNPFYSQSRLGGMNTLRGYRGGRWTDSASILYGAEARWNFWKSSGWFKKYELSFAYDTGRVYNDGAINVLFDDLRPSYVVGLSGILEKGFPIRMDIAQSTEGYQFYLHLLYPF